MASKTQKIRVPPFQTVIHLPGLPGSFVFRKNGKYRLDQSVRNFCLLNKCKGCFEVKVHFPREVNWKKIKYDAHKDHISVDTLEDNVRHQFQLKVPYPSGLKLDIPENAEAQMVFGKLSCKLAITHYDKAKVLAFHTKRRFKDRVPVKSLKEKVEDDAAKTFVNGDNEHLAEGIKLRKRKLKRREKNIAKKERKLMKSKAKPLSLSALNKRIALNAKDKNKKNNKKSKKSKKSKEEKFDFEEQNRMSVDAQHALIDKAVDAIDAKAKRQRILHMKDNEDIREMQRLKEEKKARKAQKKVERVERFKQILAKKRRAKGKDVEIKIKPEKLEVLQKKRHHDKELFDDYASSFR